MNVIWAIRIAAVLVLTLFMGTQVVAQDADDELIEITERLDVLEEDFAAVNDRLVAIEEYIAIPGAVASTEETTAAAPDVVVPLDEQLIELDERLGAIEAELGIEAEGEVEVEEADA